MSSCLWSTKVEEDECGLPEFRHVTLELTPHGLSVLYRLLDGARNVDAATRDLAELHTAMRLLGREAHRPAKLSSD